MIAIVLSIGFSHCDLQVYQSDNFEKLTWNPPPRFDSDLLMGTINNIIHKILF